MTTRFRYRAVDPSGRRERGSAEALTLEALSGSLTERGLILLDAEEEATTNPNPGVAAGGSARNAVLELTRALAALLPAGLPLPRTLAAAESVIPASLQPTTKQIQDTVEHGSALSAALAEHASLFPPAHMGVVRAGEWSGGLTGALRRLADQLEREESASARGSSPRCSIRSSSAWPGRSRSRSSWRSCCESPAAACRPRPRASWHSAKGSGTTGWPASGPSSGFPPRPSAGSVTRRRE